MIMMLATPIAPTSSATAPQAQEQRVEGAGRASLGGQCGRGLGDVDLVRVLRVGLGAEQIVNGGGGGLGADGAEVDLGRVPVEAEIALGGGEPDQDRGVDLGARAAGRRMPTT
jgi:hypothetical protein